MLSPPLHAKRFVGTQEFPNKVSVDLPKAMVFLNHQRAARVSRELQEIQISIARVFLLILAVL